MRDTYVDMEETLNNLFSLVTSNASLTARVWCTNLVKLNNSSYDVHNQKIIIVIDSFVTSINHFPNLIKLKDVHFFCYCPARQNV